MSINKGPLIPAGWGPLLSAPLHTDGGEGGLENVINAMGYFSTTRKLGCAEASSLLIRFRLIAG